jgi:hypothetical protein
MNSFKNEKINSTLIKVEALQKEYEVTLQQYQEAGKNYIAALQYNSLNPCLKYTKDTKGVSQACYKKIWTDQGCIAPEQPASNFLNSKLTDVAYDSYLWATLTDEHHRKGCYGDSTNYSTKTSPVYPDTSNPDTSYFTALKGRTWWGSAPVSEGPASTQQECETMCANSDKCSGATFNPVKRYCWTRSGDGLIATGEDDDYALISKQQEALSVMKALNNKLLDLNKQISNELSTINPEVKQQEVDRNVKQQQLNVSYQKLLNQKIDIDKQLQEYYSIEQDEMNQSLHANSQNISLRFWVFITSLVLLITLKQFFGSGSPPFSITIWLFIIIVLIILTYTLNTPTGFMMWFLLLIGVILMSSGNLPSV